MDVRRRPSARPTGLGAAQVCEPVPPITWLGRPEGARSAPLRRQVLLYSGSLLPPPYLPLLPPRNFPPPTSVQPPSGGTTHARHADCVLPRGVAAGGRYFAWSRSGASRGVSASTDVKAAIASMSSHDPAVRAAAARSLSAWPYRAEAAIPLLVRLLGDTAGVPDPLPPVPAQAAADTSPRWMSRPSRPSPRLCPTPPPRCGGGPPGCWGDSPKPEAVKALTSALGDKDASVRSAVLTALAAALGEDRSAVTPVRRPRQTWPG